MITAVTHRSMSAAGSLRMQLLASGDAKVLLQDPGGALGPLDASMEHGDLGELQLQLREDLPDDRETDYLVSLDQLEQTMVEQGLSPWPGNTALTYLDWQNRVVYVRFQAQSPNWAKLAIGIALVVLVLLSFTPLVPFTLPLLLSLALLLTGGGLILASLGQGELAWKAVKYVSGALGLDKLFTPKHLLGFGVGALGLTAISNSVTGGKSLPASGVQIGVGIGGVAASYFLLKDLWQEGEAAGGGGGGVPAGGALKALGTPAMDIVVGQEAI